MLTKLSYTIVLANSNLDLLQNKLVTSLPKFHLVSDKNVSFSSCFTLNNFACTKY